MGWSTKKELQLFLQTGAGLSDPGEKISIAPVLREILAEQREAREAQDRKETNETLPAKRNTRNRKKKHDFMQVVNVPCSYNNKSRSLFYLVHGVPAKTE